MRNIILFVMLVITLLLGCGIIGVKYYNSERRFAEEHTQTELLTITKTIADDLEYIMTTVERELRIIASMFKGKEPPSSKQLTVIFNRFFKSDGFMMSLGYIGKNRILRAAAPAALKNEIGNDYSFRNYFKKIKKYGNSVYSGVLKSYRPKKTESTYKSIYIVVPVLDKNNQFNGLLGTNLDINKVKELIQVDSVSEKLSQTGIFWVDDRNAQIVAGSHYKDDPGFHDFLISVSNARKLGKRYKDVFTFKGKKYFIASCSIENRNFALQVLGVYSYSKTLVYIPKFYYQIKWLLILVALVVIIALFIVVYNEKIVKKLRTRIKSLEIHIDETEKHKHVSDITEEDYFRELEDKITSIKKQY